MTPRLSVRGLRKITLRDFAVRFVVGGCITVLAGLITRRCEAALGGMFLAFPAILPASLTLVKRHDGRRQATDDARGGRVGAIALVGFAAMVATTATIWSAPATLAAATITWLAIAYAVWALTLGRRPPR
jgi:hypothetical protein